MIVSLGSRSTEFLMLSFWKWIFHCIFKSHRIVIHILDCQYLFRFTHFLLASIQENITSADKHSYIYFSAGDKYCFLSIYFVLKHLISLFL